MWLEERESPMKPVSGDLVTMANLLVVVRREPVSGLATRIRGLSAPNGSAPEGQWTVEQIRAEADPADEPLQDVVGQGLVPSSARGEIDDQRLSEVAAHA